MFCGRILKPFAAERNLQRVTRPQDIAYIKVLKVNLNMMGAWPAKQINGFEPQSCFFIRVFMFLLHTFYLYGEIKYLHDNIDETFFILGNLYITVLMSTVAAFRIILISNTHYHNTTGEFIQSIHLFNHRNRSPYYMEVHLLVHKLSHYFTLYIGSMMMMGFFLYNITPFYNNILSGAFDSHRPSNITFEHSIYIALPFDYTTNVKGYIIMFIINWFASFLCSIAFCAIDLFLFIMVFHMWGHLKILIHNLDNFPKPKLPSTAANPLIFSHEEMKEVRSKLKDMVSHHNLITQFASKMSDTFGWTLLIYYSFHQLSGCLLLLECSLMDSEALARYGPLTVLAFQQLIQISLVFELLGSMNDKLKDAVYGLPWECMNQNNKKIVLTFLQQSQKSMNLKAMNMVTVGLQTMASILKTSVTYFLMLQTIAKKENQ